MFTHKDIDTRTIFVVNCIEHERGLRVNSGELMLEELDGEKKKNSPLGIRSFSKKNMLRQLCRMTLIKNRQMQN